MSDNDVPITRADFERAMRHLNLSDLELREAMLQLGARVFTLIDELTRRLDGVEPDPAPPGTAAPEPEGTVEHMVNAQLGDTLQGVRVADVRVRGRVNFDLGPSKYDVEPSTPPCDEVLHLCQARCCTFNFALSPLDLDEGVLRWDYGQPYLIRQRAGDHYCVHNDATTRHCTVHDVRPRVCRTYDCRHDPRVWIDFEQRIPAPIEAATIQPALPDETAFDLLDRVKARAAAITAERTSMAAPWREPKP
jgi:Fe-S-cluster containining protein